MADINRSPNLYALAEDIRAEADKHDISCTIILTDGSGEQRIDIGNTDRPDIYTLDCSSGFLLGLSVLTLADGGKLDLAAPVSEYIPPSELPEQAAEACALHLLCRNEGLPDPIHGVLLPRLHRSVDFVLLDRAAEEEARVLRAHRSFAAQTALLGEAGDICTTGLAPSPLDEALLAELVRRVSGMSSAGFVKEYILEQLGLNGQICSGEESCSDDTVRLTAGDLTVLMNGMISGKLPEENSRKLAADTARGGHTLPFGRRREIFCARSRCGDDVIEMLMDFVTGSGVLIAAHSPLPELRRGDRFTRLDIDIAEMMNARRIYPVHTRMERLSRHNISDALAVEPGDGQIDFVSSPAAAIADALTGQGEAFVIREGSTAVGLLTFTSSAVPGTIIMDTLIIDRRYQWRGFGRIAVKWAINYQRDKGTDRLLVCVDRRNSGALALYGRRGFEISEVHDGAYVLVKVL